jgi:hypothetical protein
VNYQSHSGDGSYEDASGAWDVGDLNDDHSATLHIVVEVVTGTGGIIITNTAAVSESLLTDLSPENDAGDAFIVVQESDALETQITPSAGGTLTYTDTQGLTTTVELPTDAVKDDVTLIYTPVPSPTKPLPGDLQFANHAFTLEVYDCPECTPLPGYAFKHPITITIHYSYTDVLEVKEDELMLEYWNDDTGEWEDVAATCDPNSTYTRDLDTNWISVSLCHLTPFALLGSPGAAVGGITEPFSLPALSQPQRLELVDGLLLLVALVAASTVAALALRWRRA